MSATDTAPTWGVAERAAALRALGATPAACDELLAYAENRFERPAAPLRLPLEDEPFVAWWRLRADEAACTRGGAAAVLARWIPELRDAPLDSVSLAVHETLAGRLPVLLARDRAEFEELARRLARRGSVPPSAGAYVVGGYANRLRQAELWHARGGCLTGGGPSGLADFLRTPDGRRLGYDRLVILSAGPYSGVDAARVGAAPEEWPRLSHTIRLEHECAHYFTRRALGRMTNALHDEIVADYAGITRAAGRFRADWFLAFMGVGGGGAYRAGGRLENYRGTPPLSDDAFAVLARLAARAARAMECHDAALPARRSALDHGAALLALASLPLEALAAEGAGGADALAAAYAEARRLVRPALEVTR